MQRENDSARSGLQGSKAVTENNTGTGISRPAVQTVFSPQPLPPVVQRAYNKIADPGAPAIIKLKEELIEHGLSALTYPASAMTRKFNELITDKRNYTALWDIFEVLESVTESPKEEGVVTEKPFLAEKSIIAEQEKKKTKGKEKELSSEDEWGDDEGFEEDEEEYNYDDYEDDSFIYTGDTQEKEAEEDDKSITEDLKGVKAVVVVIGSKMKARQIAPIKEAYNGLKEKPADTAILANDIFNAIGEVKARGLAIDPGKIQQAIDQEISHLDIAVLASKKLTGLGAGVQLYRPPDQLLILPVAEKLQGSFIEYSEGLGNVARFINSEEKIIIVTIGHGAEDGSVNFPGESGTVLPNIIGQRLGIEGRSDVNSFLYIPLQCFPQKAVRKARDLGWHSASIENEGKSDDLEMERWIKQHLKGESKKWAGPTKGL